jgi:hypothetical protein
LDILTYAQIRELVALGFSLVYRIQIQQFELNKPVETNATLSQYIGGADNTALSLLEVFASSNYGGLPISFCSLSWSLPGRLCKWV